MAVEDIRKALEAAPGVTVKDDAQNYVYPMPLESAGKDDVYVGRIRKDLADDNGNTLCCLLYTSQGLFKIIHHLVYVSSHLHDVVSRSHFNG